MVRRQPGADVVDNSDGISMGTNGMRYSLQSRDLIADSIEVSCLLLVIVTL